MKNRYQHQLDLKFSTCKCKKKKKNACHDYLSQQQAEFFTKRWKW